MDEATRIGAPLPVAAAVWQQLNALMAQGWGTQDIRRRCCACWRRPGRQNERAPMVAAPKKASLELNAIFENATVGILFTHNRKLMQANRLCAEMFGYALEEFLGQPALILYERPEAYSALGREAGPVLSAGKSFRAETQLKRRDGSLFWCRVSAKAVDPEHPRDGTLWIIEDITEDR
jgi:PAS domain S-box-containing protein